MYFFLCMIKYILNAKFEKTDIGYFILLRISRKFVPKLL